jgi:hypothetical protein
MLVFIIFVIPFYVGSECGDTFLLIISWYMECHLGPVGLFSQVHRVFWHGSSCVLGSDFFAVTIPKYNSPTLLLLSKCCAVLIYLSLSFILVLPRLCVEHHFHMAWYSCHLTVTRLVSLVEQEVPTLPQHMCSPAVFVWVRVARSFFLCNVLFIVVCSFVLFPLTIICLLFFGLRLLLTTLVSSDFSEVHRFDSQ